MLPSLHYANLVVVAPRARLVYVAIPKAASTSILTMLMDGEGARSRQRHPRGPQPTDGVLVHDHEWYPLPQLYDLRPHQADHVLTSPSWTRFTAVRDPWRRLFSAWSDKVLLGDPTIVGHDDPELTTALRDGEVDVSHHFGRFVERLASGPVAVGRDAHFLPQSFLLDHCVRVDRVVTVAEIDDVRRLIEARSSRPVAMPATNRGIGLDVVANTTPVVLGMIRDAYRSDYDRFGFELPEATSPVARRGEVLGARECALVVEVRARNRRIMEVGTAPLRGLVRQSLAARVRPVLGRDRHRLR